MVIQVIPVSAEQELPNPAVSLTKLHKCSFYCNSVTVPETGWTGSFNVVASNAVHRSTKEHWIMFLLDVYKLMVNSFLRKLTLQERFFYGNSFKISMKSLSNFPQIFW